MRTPVIPRIRRWVITVLATVGLLVAGTTPALAGSGSGHDLDTYLALGDSVPFGLYLSADPSVYRDAHNFVGYPEDLAAELHLRLLDASCPGETTGSFMDVSAPSNGCSTSVANGKVVPGGYRTMFPLHVTYASPVESQVQYALRVLRNRENDVDLITLTLGANDVFVCRGTTADACASPSELQAVAKQIHANLDTILSTLRTQGRYHGRIAVVDYYSPDYADVRVTQALRLIDTAIDTAAAEHRALVVSGFRAFRSIALARAGGDSRAAGLVRPAPDLHPTPRGQDVLEDAVQHALSRLHHDDQN